MQWLQRVIPPVLVLAAVAVLLATVVSSHKTEYGSAPIPGGGVVHLPKGTTTVFVDDENVAGGGEAEHLAGTLVFELIPVGGGDPLPEESSTSGGSAEGYYDRSEGILTRGAVAKVEVPATGDYRVTGDFKEPVQGATIDFGLTAFGAVADKWKILAGLLGAAFLITLLPTPRRRAHYESDSEAEQGAGYQTPRVNPYNG
jgi:hypothetical protein